MKKVTLILTMIIAMVSFSCTGPTGPQGATGRTVESEVFELRNINFAYNATDGFNIYQTLSPQIYASDVLLIYRLAGTIDANTPIWEHIPNTYYLAGGNQLHYDFDFSKEDFKIYAGGNYDVSTTPSFLNNQTFRIVIVPGYFSNKNAQVVDLNNYNAVIKAYNINESNIKVLNK